MSELAPIGLQLYTLREALADDFHGIIRQVAAMGYIGVEAVGSMAVPHAEAAALFNALGLQVISIHAPLPLGDDLPAVLAMVEAYELTRVVCPWRPPEDFATVEKIKQTCDVLNEAAQAAAEHGFGLGYHNHWAEMEMVEGKPAYKHMIEYLDPSVFFEFDTYWAKVAGQDPAAVAEDLGERAPLLHIKDGPASDHESPMTAVGAGVLDFPAIIAAAQATAAWHIVELDRCATDMLTAVAESYAYLVKEGLARGNKN